MFVVQHVDVCMFSNGKFKNVVAMVDSKEELPLPPGASLNRTYSLGPTKGATKNWIALEDSYAKGLTNLASTVTCSSPEERNVFAIYVTYYVKVRYFFYFKMLSFHIINIDRACRLRSRKSSSDQSVPSPIPVRITVLTDQ